MADKLPTKPYKGTRDFYPEDMAFRREMFRRWSEVCRRYGYGEVDGPLIEPLELYASKTSDEIVSKQLYSFTDRGDRAVALRPEFTPTLARLAAARLQDLPLPVRWFGIPNVWRYEKPQRGRLREHWQLNVDIFGAPAPDAEVEILCLAQDILQAFGATGEHYEVRVNSRRLTDVLFRDHVGLNDAGIAAASGALDRRAKIGEEKFDAMLTAGGLTTDQQHLLKLVWSEDLDALAARVGPDHVAITEVRGLIERLTGLGYGDSLTFDLAVMRGFTYYTGIVFEVFDRHPDNNRSMFGGGRYDNLVGAFTKQALSGIGFGMGDVTFENFLRVHDLMPVIEPPARAAVVVMGREASDRRRAEMLAAALRRQGLEVAVMLAGGKMGKQIQVAEKGGYRFVLIQGPDESERGVVGCKDLESGEQVELSLADVTDHLGS